MTNTNLLQGSYRQQIQGGVYLHVEGDPYQRGYQYGYLASEEITDTIQRWMALGHQFGFMNRFFWLKEYDDISEKWWEICKEKSQKHFLGQIPEEYINEMRGLKDGINDAGCTINGEEVEFEDILASQFVQDVQYGYFSFKFKRFRILPHLHGFLLPKILSPFLTQFDSMFNSLISNDDGHYGHCNAFIATGDATKNGKIVAGHSTIFHNLLGERCNVILDMRPSNGHRFLMTCPPGSLWSQEDWYQNDQGIILTETELTRQGPFKIRGNIPKGVRSRKAIQYGSSLDEVIDLLQEGNNGLVPNEWLIGDTKTNEIASLQQAYYNTPVEKKSDGYFYSANLPHDPKVRLELRYYINLIGSKAIKAISRTGVISQAADARDKQLQQLMEEYYGDINSETAKEILSASPLSNKVTDGKITSTRLMQENGLLAFIGNPNGVKWTPSEEYSKNFRMATVAPACGWSEILPKQSPKSNPGDEISEMAENKETNEYWKFTSSVASKKMDKPSMVHTGTELLVGFSDGMLYSLNSSTGKCHWERNLTSTIYDITSTAKQSFIATNNGIIAINNHKGEKRWSLLEDKIIISLSDNCDDNILGAGCHDGSFYLIDCDNQQIKLEKTFEHPVFVSNVFKDSIALTTGKSVFSYNTKTNEISWSFETNGRNSIEPIFEDKTVYVGSWDHHFYAINDDGELKWKKLTDWGVKTKPCFDRNFVYFGSLDSTLYCVSKLNGSEAWRFACHAAIQSNPSIFGEYIFFGSDDGNVYAVNKSTGEYVWSFAPKYALESDTINNYVTTPISADILAFDESVFVCADTSVHALDSQTEEKIVPIKESGEQDITLFVVSIVIILLLLISFFMYTHYKKNQ